MAPVTKVWELTVSNAVPQLRIGAWYYWLKEVASEAADSKYTVKELNHSDRDNS